MGGSPANGLLLSIVRFVLCPDALGQAEPMTHRGRADETSTTLQQHVWQSPWWFLFSILHSIGAGFCSSLMHNWIPVRSTRDWLGHFDCSKDRVQSLLLSFVWLVFLLHCRIFKLLKEKKSHWLLTKNFSPFHYRWQPQPMALQTTHAAVYACFGTGEARYLQYSVSMYIAAWQFKVGQFVCGLQACWFFVMTKYRQWHGKL
jgi:hypothetical protein